MRELNGERTFVTEYQSPNGTALGSFGTYDHIMTRLGRLISGMVGGDIPKKYLQIRVRYSRGYIVRHNPENRGYVYTLDFEYEGRKLVSITGSES